jgi:hypothetical protein
MNPLTSLLFPVFFGLMAGIGHGVISDHNNLPFSLMDQLFQPLNPSMVGEE